MDKQYPHSDELTLKELILAVQDYFWFFLRKWYWFLLGAGVLGGVFFWNAYSVPVTYTAPLTFLMNNDKDKSAGKGALLGSLGLGASESGGGTAAKLMELGKSRQVLGRILFDSATVDGKSQLIADHLIEVYDYHTDWEESEALAGFLFNGKRPEAGDRLGNRVFKSLHGRMIREKEGILLVKINPETGLFEIRSTTPTAELSIVISEKVFAELSDYFINSSVSDKRVSLEQLSERADSVQIELARAENQLARSQDRLAQVPLRQSAVRQNKMERDVYILSTMYSEIIKNRETAAFLLSSERPAFNLVDAPLEPLGANREPTFSAGVMGGVLGLMLVGVVLFVVKLVRDAMK